MLISCTFFARGQLSWTKQVSSAALAESGPLDFRSRREKNFFKFFAHKEGLGHMFQKWS